MKLSNQYLSFLGGEVSESLWYRTDMDKFNKWFANAENIRFTTMGSFSNRPGFKRLGPVLDYKFKPLVKLIPFVFNNEEVFEIEFITGQFRVRKNGEVIVREDGSEVVYDSPIKIESLQQLKYAQSGDIIFIASGTSPVMELRRLKTDGTEWQLTQFASDIMPLGEVNEDKKKTVALGEAGSGDLDLLSTVQFMIGDPLYKYNIKSTGTLYAIFPKIRIVFNFFENNEKYERVFIEKSLGEVVSELQNDTKINEILNITATWTNWSPNLSRFKKGYSYLNISTKAEQKGKISSVDIYLQQVEEQIIKNDFVFLKEPIIDGDFAYEKQCNIYDIGDGFFPAAINEPYGVSSDYRTHGDPLVHPKTMEEAVELLKQKTAIEQPYCLFELEEGDGKKYIKTLRTWHYSSVSAYVFYTKEITKHFSHSFSIDSDKYKSYLISCPKSLAFNKGDIISVENKINAGEIVETVKTTTDWKSKEILGKSKWRYYTSGNWKGELRIFYSNDNGKSWKTLRTSVSNHTQEPGIFNENTSGTIESEDTLLFKMEGKVDSGEVNINFFTDSFEVNSYYKILEKREDGVYYAWCVKNDVGNINQTHKWRMSAFSEESGYPESIGFYQNRLFLAKGYELWGSKINDFWDFYEPIELKKDDPINMSILTYKVNTIKNILTTKSFFVFTTGGEFGIASQGAISQDDKFLKQFSSHGSNDCQPLIVGNLVVFVDSTGNTVRAFQYSFESDSYEANDITIFIEEKLKGKNIITTEYIKSTKECLFLDSDGVIWVFKYMPEQNIMAWSHWKHGQYKITNMCVSPRGEYDDLYVVVDAPDGKFVEKLDEDIYSDSVEEYFFEETVDEVQTQLTEGKVVNVDDGINNKYKTTVGASGIVKLRSPSDNVKIGLSYNSTATLLTPTISLQDGTYTTFRKQKLNKAYFIYKDSFGFKVGEENSEKMEIDFQSPADSIESQVNLSSGKKSVLIPNTYDGTARLSFVQDEPYPMKIVNVLLESDYGGQ